MGSGWLLLLASAIWGFSFVAQRVGMEHIGPFSYNGIRFFLGAISLLPLLVRDRRIGVQLGADNRWRVLNGGLLAGVLLFIGSSLQQVGLVYTTAGKAAFITGLYVVIVPLLGLLWGQQARWSTWLGAALAVAGLYLLTATEDLNLAYGDALELLGSFFWAGHVLVIGWLSSRRIDPMLLAFLQFLICAMLSLIVAFATETVTLARIREAAWPLFYGGFLSVGIAFTLQVIAQRDTPSAHAAIILSLETVFAAIGGSLLLEEKVSSKGLYGCVLMFAGMALSQWGIAVTSPFQAKAQRSRSTRLDR